MTISSLVKYDSKDATRLFGGKTVEHIDLDATIATGVHQVKIVFTDGTWLQCTSGTVTGVRNALMSTLFDDGGRNDSKTDH